jgi:hypothetical protein
VVGEEAEAAVMSAGAEVEDAVGVAEVADLL